MDHIKHVAIYLRLSRDEEGKGLEEVLKNHREILVKLVKENKWSYELFEEVASSRSIEGRLQMTNLLDRIEQQHFDGVVVIDVDRLSRNEYDAPVIKKVLHYSNTLIITPTRIYDPSSDDDSLLLGITNLVAQQEYKQILKRMRRGKMFAQRQGHWTNGIAPLGYTKDAKIKKLIPNERSEDVRYIFNEIVNGTLIPTLIQQLSTMGIKTRDDKAFHYNSIVRIINNEVYKGTIISNRTIGKHESIRPKEEWIIVHNAHEPIVDAEIWEKANKLVNEYSFKAPRSKNRTYPTSNLIFCGQCAKNGIDKSQGCNLNKKLNKIYIKVCRTCGNRVHYYNPILQNIKDDVLKRRDTIVEAIQTLEDSTEIDNSEYELERLNKQIDKVLKALEKIEILFEEDEIDLPTYRKRKNIRLEEIKSIESQIEHIKVNNISDKKKSLQEQLEAIEELFTDWELLDGKGLKDEEVNRMLHYLIEKIYWTFEKGSDQPFLKIVYKKKIVYK